MFIIMKPATILEGRKYWADLGNWYFSPQNAHWFETYEAALAMCPAGAVVLCVQFHVMGM